MVAQVLVRWLARFLGQKSNLSIPSLGSASCLGARTEPHSGGTGGVPGKPGIATLSSYPNDAKIIDSFDYFSFIFFILFIHFFI